MEEAVEKIQARGEDVNKLTVRKELGDTGSYTTILNFLKGWKARQPKQDDPKEVHQPIPEPVQALFGKAWAAAQATAQAEIALERESMAKMAIEMNQVIEKCQVENEEALRVLELQMESLTTQLAEASAREQTWQNLLAERAEKVGYLTSKLESLEESTRKQLADRDARLAQLEFTLPPKARRP
jgi:hypothetical protein